jgi:hypothetical protein
MIAVEAWRFEEIYDFVRVYGARLLKLWGIYWIRHNLKGRNETVHNAFRNGSLKALLFKGLEAVMMHNCTNRYYPDTLSSKTWTSSLMYSE